MGERETPCREGAATQGGRALVRPRLADGAFQAFVDSVPDYAIFMLDPAGCVATWNAGARRTKGWEADEIVGAHFSRFYLPEEVARGKPDHALEVAAREGCFEEEGWRLRQDGSRFWADVVITAVRSPAGELLGFGKVTRDLTARKRAEDERLAMTAREEGLRAREELLVVTAHELRTPIAALQLHADLIRRAAGDERPGDGRLAERVRRLQHSASRLSRLVDAVLRVAVLEPRRIALERRRLDLRALVARIVADHAPDAAAAGCTVELKPGPPVELLADGPLTEVLVENLLANALKYGARRPVSLRVAAQAGVASLTVEDHGIGIALDRQPRLFDRFSRAVSTRHYGGIGLGLWTVRTIAEAHGGAARVTSTAGEGATFEVSLPLGVPAEAEAGASP